MPGPSACGLVGREYGDGVNRDGFQPVRRLSESPWLAASIAVLAALGGLLLKVKSDSWVLPVVLFVVAAVSGGLTFIAARASRQEKARQLVENTSELSRAGSLPVVSELTPDAFRVHTAGVDVPYIPRDRQTVLRTALIGSQPVLVVGHSMSGKTRMAYEVVRELYPTWKVWFPARPEGLTALLKEGVPNRVLVWLDDLEVFLTAKEPCTVTTLQRLQNAGCRVLATLRTSEYDKFQPVGELRPPQLDFLQSMTLIRLEDEQDEQDRMAAQVSDPQTAAGIRRYGLAEYVGGGYLGFERFRNGKAVHPLGVAALRATNDWHRLGFDFIPEITLAALASVYLGQKVRDNPGESYQQALDWAKESIGGRIRLLEATGSGWRVFDYLRDYLTGLDEPIPQQAWAEALTAVTGDPRRALTLGYRAYRRELTDLAIQSWRIAAANLSDPSTQIAGGHRDAAAQAAFNLGFLLREQGDPAGAAGAYQLAIDSGHADAAPKAALSLEGLQRTLSSSDTRSIDPE